MHTATLLLTRQDKTSDHDDRIVISQVADCSEMYHVTYSTPDFVRSRRFTASYSSVLRYVEDILISLQYDVDPFEMVQAYTAVHPCIIYHVADMSDCCIRRTIVSQIRDALRFNVTTGRE